MRLKRTLPALLAALALLAAACGGGDDSGDAEDTAPTSPPSDASPDDGDGAAGEAVEEPMAPMAMTTQEIVEAALDADLDDCAEAPAGGPFIIGFAADLSEVGGFADVPISAAARHYVDLINCAGGVNGVEVQLVIEDIQGDPEVTQRAAQDLLDAGVHVILGPPFADFGQPLLQTVNARVPVLFVASTEPVLPDVGALSFLTTFDDTAQATAAANFAIDQGFTRAITFSAEGPYFGYNPEVFAEVFTELGGEVVIDQSYVPFEDFDFSAQANEVAGTADGTEILYTAMIADQVAALRSQLEELGVDVAYIGPDAFEVTGLAAAENNEGIWYTTHAFAEPDNRLGRLLSSFEAATGAASEAPTFAGLAGDAITVAIEAYQQAGEADPAALGAVIAAIDGLEAITGITGYAGTDGVPSKPVYIHQMVDGAPVLAATFGG